MAVEGTSLPFKEAIEFLERKVNLPTRRSDDLRHAAHVRGFSVAGVTRDDMLTDFRTAMEKAQLQGTGFQEFQKDFDAIVERTGWKFFAIGESEEERRAWRAGVIYNTNMRTAYMGGRYQQMTHPDVIGYRPFWCYEHSGSEHYRPRHKALDGKVYRADDPLWLVYFPPNGWGCFCDVRALSERDLAEMGKSGPDEKPDWMVASEGNDPRTGQIEERWPGIDRGWEYNVGVASQDGPVPVELQAPLPPHGEGRVPLDLPDLPAPHPVPDSRIMADDEDPQIYVDAFLAEFGADRDKPQIWRDPSGGVVTISQRLFETRSAAGETIGEKADKAGRGRYLLLMADAIMDPDEIWVDWVEVASGIALRRTYLRHVMLTGGRQGFVRFEWSPKGWIGVTAFPATAAYIERARTGALLYRQK